MTEHWDVCIIGAGLIGASIARELSRFQLSVALLERRSDVGEGTSKANSGIVHAGYDARPGSEKARLNRLGSEVFESVCNELNVPYRRNGALVVAFSEEDLGGLMSLLKRGRVNGIRGLSILSEAELRVREPNIGPTVRGALLAETSAICSPYELTIALAEHALINGVAVRLNCAVEAVCRARDGFDLETTQGSMHCRVVINAAGVHAAWINDQLSEDRFLIQPRRGEYWMIDKRYGDAFRSTIFQLPTRMGKGVLVTPTVEDTLLLGPTAEDVIDGDDVRTTSAGLAEVLRVAAVTWPAMPGREFITEFSGNRAHCDRDDFIVGPAPDVPGYFRAAGIESPGLTAAPAIGSEIAAAAAEFLAAEPRLDFHPPLGEPVPFRLQNDAQKQASLAANPAYSRVICRCEHVTEAEIVYAIRRPLGATTVDGIKRRARAGMGRCQGGFCLPRVLEILERETGCTALEITKSGGATQILTDWAGANPVHERAEQEHA